MSKTNGYEGDYNGDYTTLDVNSSNFELIDDFITTTEPKVISNLIIGDTYYIVEDALPEGSDFAIKVSSDAVKIVETRNYDVLLINNHSNFKISK